MKSYLGYVGFFLAAVSFSASAGQSSEPLALNPENPHYFLFRGKPMVIITSGEHYGSVINLDFDYVKYLNTLSRDGLNATRTWAGAYCEPSTAFQIASNTLAPLAGRFICPWARSDQPGYANGGNKFELSRWDPAYFARLKDFMSAASKRGIIVELNLFCPFYDESMWRLSPMNAANNVNGIGAIERTNVYTLDKSGGLLKCQEQMVRKLVSELRDFDNLYYEICNEPYFGGVTLEWQRHISQVIVDEESKTGRRHLISQNIANGKAKITEPDPNVSIFNFHYASPPDTVGLNYGLNRVIGDNETGFRGTNDAPYRMEAWDFVAAGGGLFNNLDYSFVAGHENGTFVFPASQPGGGNPGFRRQLQFLAESMRRLDFVHMQPDKAVFQAELPPGASLRALVRPGKDYLLYLRTGLSGKKGSTEKTRFADGELSFKLELPAGEYRLEWQEPATCRKLSHQTVTSSGGFQVVKVPAFQEDIACLVQRRKAG